MKRLLAILGSPHRDGSAAAGDSENPALSAVAAGSPCTGFRRSSSALTFFHINAPWPHMR